MILTIMIGAGVAEVTIYPATEFGPMSPIAGLPLDSPWRQRSVYLGPLVPPAERHLRAPIAQ